MKCKTCKNPIPKGTTRCSNAFTCKKRAAAQKATKPKRRRRKRRTVRITGVAAMLLEKDMYGPAFDMDGNLTRTNREIQEDLEFYDRLQNGS